MGAISGRIASGVLVAWACAACGPDQPFAGSSAEVGHQQRLAAVPLEEAVAQGLIEVVVRDHNCTRTEMGLVLVPKDTSQAWIRVDAGLQTSDPRNPDQCYVTTETRFVRLARRSNLLVTIPHVQRTMFRSFGIPSGARLSRCDDDRLMKFLTALGKRSVRPKWKELQIATWALTEDIEFDRVRPPSNDGKVKLRVHPTAEARELLRVLALLEQVGYEKAEFALWTGALDEVDRLVSAYETLMDVDDRRALNPFRDLCALYPFESASDILIGCFDRHQGEVGLPYRRHAFETLQEIGGPAELKIIKGVLALESDQALLEQMTKASEVAASPVK